jgi:uncharacterized integral membrane protein
MNANHKLTAILVLGGLLLIFVIQNTAPVEIRLFFWTFALSRALMFFFLVSIGIVIGWLLRGRLGNRHIL